MKRMALLLVFGACLAVVGSSSAQQAEQQTPEDQIRRLQADNNLLKATLERRNKEIAALKAEPAQAEVEALKKELAALKKELAALKKESNVQQATEPTVSEGIVPPVHDQPKSLKGLYDRLKDKVNDPDAAKKLGFICKPLGIDSVGLVESIYIETVVDKTNMIVRIRFPELRAVEMAPDPHPQARHEKGFYDAMGKAWQTGDEQVWIRGIDTSGLIDKQLIYLTVPLKVVDTTQYDTVGGGSKTIYLLNPTSAAKRPRR